MDEKKQNTLISPAYLFIGPEDRTSEHAHTFIQTILCPHNACKICSTCINIRKAQHHALMWFCPEKQYTRESLTDLFSTITLSLEPEEHFFFVFEKAELLSHACANSLLKSIEEPPPGYHFIFLTQRPQQLLATIRSRCVTQMTNKSTDYIPQEELYRFFTQEKINDPLEFAHMIEKIGVTEHETVQLLDILLEYWLKQYKQEIISQNSEREKKIDTIIRLLQKAITQPPMPGSSKIFWKNLFLQLH